MKSRRLEILQLDRGAAWARTCRVVPNGRIWAMFSFQAKTYRDSMNLRPEENVKVVRFR